MSQTTQARIELKAAAGRGDYAGAVRSAAVLAPGKERELELFRSHMELCERAMRTAEWRRALRALAEARSAAVAAGLPDLESISTERMYTVIKLREEYDQTCRSAMPHTLKGPTAPCPERTS